MLAIIQRKSHPLVIPLLILLLLSLVGFTVFSLVRPGNNLGIDEWIVLYRSLQGGADFSNRPLAIVVMRLIAPLFQANVAAYHVLSILFWVANAYLLVGIIHLLDPDRPVFALLCGILYLVYFQDDFWIPLFFPQTSDILTVVLVTQIALWAHLAYMNRPNLSNRVRSLLLVISLLFAFVAPLVREASVPILIGMPVMVFVLQRRYDRARWLGLALFCGAVIVAAMPYALALIGVGGVTYGSGLFVDLDPIRMTNATLIQFRFMLDPLIERASARPVIAVVLALCALIGAGVLILIRLFPERIETSLRHNLRREAIWIAGSVITIFLGFAAFLPTSYADSLWRTHMLSRPAEASLIASVIWLISDVVPPKAGKWAVRVLGAFYVAAAGSAMLWQQQHAIERMGGTWGDLSTFMVSLAESVPDVEAPTLFVYMENPDPFEAPFTSGFAFQYAMRYFYSDRATGMIPTDQILGTVEVSDDGILMTEDWVDEPHLFGWDEIIFIAEDADGAVYILDTLPDEFATPARERKYDPTSRIADGAAAERIRETFEIGE